MFAAIASIVALGALTIDGLERARAPALPAGDPRGVSGPRQVPSTPSTERGRSRCAAWPRRYGDGVEALRDVNLAFPQGQLSTLLGPSGCGKTTLLKIIAGLIPRNAGEVLVKGKPVDGPGPERAFVFQDFALLPWADSAAQRRLRPRAARHNRKGKGEAVARRYIAEVGLKGFEHRHPSQLSGGMRQRVGLARALTVDADIILMEISRSRRSTSRRGASSRRTCSTSCATTRRP